MRGRSVARGSVLPLATLLLLALVACGPLWGPGLLNTRGGGDSPFLLLRTHQLAANLRAGIFPVRWMPDAAYGLGYPFFSYYAALPYYLAAGLVLVGLDILSAVKLTQTLFFAAAALGMYGWARRVLRSDAGGWLAAFAYALAPFHLVNLYVRGDSLSEFAAFAFYPLILWGLDHLAARPSLCRTFPPALAYAGLIVTHNISALIFSPFALLYIVVLSWTGQQAEAGIGGQATRSSSWFGIHSSGAVRFAICVSSLVIGLLLSAWFWLPALGETGYVQLTSQTTGYFFYGNHFRGGNLVQWTAIFDYAIGLGGRSPFAMGLAQVALAAAAVLVVVGNWAVRWGGSWFSTRSLASSLVSREERGRRMEARRGVWAFALIGLIFSTWLMTPLSRALWDYVPLLAMVQFPWRFLSLQALFTGLLTGAVITDRPRWRWPAAAVLAAVLTATALAGLHPQYLPITPDEVTIERLQLYELFTGNIGSSIRCEYLPRWVEPRPYTSPALFHPEAPPRPIALVGGPVESADQMVREPTRQVWTVASPPGGAEVAFPIYYWPGWRATVDGSPVDVKPAADSGYLTLRVPSGEHTVVMWLGRTPLRAGAEGISLVAALALVGTVVISWRRKPEQRSPARNLQSAIRSFVRDPRSLVAFASVVLLGLLVALSPNVAPADDAYLTMDFGQMPYLHHNPQGIALGGASGSRCRVTSYRYNSERFAPGETLEVTLSWQVWQEGKEATLGLVAPAAVRHDELRAMVETTIQLQPDAALDAAPWASSTTVDLPVPDGAPPGLYMPRLQGKDASAEPIYLRPVWVWGGETAAEQPTMGLFANGALRLHNLESVQPVPDRLDLRLDWSAARSVSGNYGVSLQLVDPAGNEWARLDTQPGYGFLPTSLWSVGHLIHDRYVLSLPAGVPPGDGYDLIASLYRVATWESLGEFVSPVSLPRATLRPEGPLVVRFGDELALSRLELPETVRQGEALPLKAYWLAVEKPSRDYVAEWRLETVEETIRATLPLASGSPPTSWPTGAWIAGRAALHVAPTTPAGTYTLSLTLRDPISGAALGTYTAPQAVRVRARERVWEVPSMRQQVKGRFGGMIELAGYDLEREGDTLRVTLYWRALEAPDQHYMLFVHLADPTTGRPAAQVDTMPREFTYPTGMWAPGEIVSDVVRLPLEDVPPGRYDLAVGWYDPQTNQRLAATDRTGTPWPDDRLLLPDGVTLP